MEIYDLIDPAILTETARLALADEDRPANQFVLGQWFPNNEVDDIYYSVTQGTTRSFTDAMPIRSWNTETPMGRRPGRTTMNGEMPPWGIKYLMTEYDRLRQRAAGGDLAAILEGDVFADVDRGMQAFLARMEQLYATILVNGSLTIAGEENGVRGVSIDYGRNSGNSVTVSDAWSDAADGKPLSDELAMVEFMVDNEGLGAADLVAVANRKTINWMTLSDEVRSAAPTVRTQARLSGAQLNEVRTSHELPALLEYNARSADVGGTVAKHIPDGYVLYLPAGNAVGETVLGAPPMADEIELEADNRPGPIAYMGKTIDPLNVYVVIDAVGIPALKDPNATAVINGTAA